jgi:hypothetical protein
VPGPLEARRRLGKRRMAYASESTPSNPLNLGFAWDIFGFLGEKDRTKFTYEAPTSRSQLVDRAPARGPLKWLSRWIAKDPPKTNTRDSDEVEERMTSLISVPDEKLYNRVRAPSTSVWQPASMAEVCAQRVLSFQESLTSAKGDGRELCNEFNEWLCQSLRRGDLSKETLESILSDDFIHNIQQFSQGPLEVEDFCFHLIRSICKGILDSGRNKYGKKDGAVIERLLSIISGLSLRDVKVQGIAESILFSLSKQQLVHLRTHLRTKEAGFYQLVGAWARTWVDNSYANPDEACAKQISNEEDFHLSYLRLVHTLQTVSNQIAMCQAENNGVNQMDFIKGLQVTLQTCKESIAEILRHIELRENEASPIQTSIATLSNVMNEITGSSIDSIVETVVLSCSTRVLELCDHIKEGRSRELRCRWMSVIASMPAVNSKLFRKSWKLLNLSNVPDQVPLIMDMLLRHWRSRGYLKTPELVINNFTLLSVKNVRHIKPFMHAVNRWEHNTSGMNKMVANLIQLLAQSGHCKAIYQVIGQLHRDGIYTTTSIISLAIRAVADVRPRLGYEIYTMSRRRGARIMLKDHSGLVLGLISETSIPPIMIWNALSIPSKSKVQLSPQILELVGNMAIAFAWSTTRPSRVSLRNVIKCLHILRVHNAPLTSDITQAITHAGLTRRLIEGGFVSLDRLKWALDLIERVEGKEVAETVDEIIYQHRCAKKGVAPWLR